MKANVPWLRVFVEGVVIVGSILLAFAIEATWQQRQEREEERRLLQNVRQELTDARDVVEEAVGLHRQLQEDALRVAEFNLSLRSETPPDSVLGSIYLNFTFAEIETALLDGATSAGQLSLILNEDIRRRLGAWPQRVGDFVEQEDLIVNKVVANEPLLYAAVDFSAANVQALRNGEFRGLFLHASPRTLEFLKSNVGQSIATMRAINEAVAVRDGERLLVAIDELLVLLATELD